MSQFQIPNTALQIPNALGQHKASQFDNTLFQFCQQTEVMGVEPNKMGEKSHFDENDDAGGNVCAAQEEKQH